MEQEQSAYITSLHLKGYKSIRDVSVTLNKGLNILIGANGSGKTNFLAFLDAAYICNHISLLNGKKFEVNIQGFPISINTISERAYNKDMKGIVYHVETTVSLGETKLISITYFNENKQLISFKSDPNNPFVTSINFGYQTFFLRFDNPIIEILKERLSLNLTIIRDDIMLGDELIESNLFHSFLKNNGKNSFLNRIFTIENQIIDDNKTIENAIEEILNNQRYLIDFLRQNLKQFSPIKDIRIDWGLARITIQEEEQSSLIEGIDFDFLVNNEWFKWTQLSDGTKRLFYLIGSVTYAKENEIILIEEPELGVHPHQLALLMNFLKSESRDKQIIISTHSPQVLNCLGEDELDRIIVARHEGKAGTKLYHLSEREKGVASEYMKNEAFLSDYWMLSGFMNEEMPEEL